MAYVEAFVMWRLKDGIKLEKENITYFSPGGYTFTHKSGKTIAFDFNKSMGNFIEKDGLFDFNQTDLDNDFITFCLEQNEYNELIQEEYDFDFFVGGKINLESNEVFCSMDLTIEGKLQSDVDFSKYMEPVYLEIFDTNDSSKSVKLLNKLTDKEYYEYFGRYEDETSKS